MKSPFVVRLWILIGALHLVGGGTIYGLASAWHRVHQLQSKFNSPQFQSFQLASEIRRGLQSLNGYMLDYVLVRDPQKWSEFEKASDELDHWIDERDLEPGQNRPAVLTTENERQAFKELNLAYDALPPGRFTPTRCPRS
jgi:hypothetical protein